MKNFIKIASLVLVLFISAAALADEDDQLKAGREAIQKGDYQAAIIALREAVKNDKKNPQGYILLGTALLRADSTDAAIAALVQARELDSANANIYMLLGDVYTKQRIAAAAIDQYKKVTEFDPKNIEAFFKMAEGYRKARQYNEAADNYRKVLALDSVHVAALREVTTIYLRAKQWANAAPLFERLTSLRPDSLRYQIQYVKALSESNQFDKMIPVAEEILKKDPAQLDVRTRLIEAYTKTKQPDKVTQLTAGVNPDSLSVDALIDAAKSFRQTEQWEKAIEYYLRAMKKDSSKLDLPYELGTTYMKVKKYEEAIEMFEKKIACDTSAGYRFASHLNEAMSLMQLKKFAEAKDHIKKSIELRPDNVQAWLTLAEDVGQMDQIADEIAAYKKVIELANADTSDSPKKYSNALGEAYRMIGIRYLIEATKIDVAQEKERKEKFVLSLKYLEQALLYNPKDCSVLLWVAQANQNINKKDEAKKYYHKVCDTCPKSKECEDAKKGLKGLGEE